MMTSDTRVRELARNRALATASRVRMLETLQREARPLDAHELGRLVGLHPSTVRFHLRALEVAGMVERRVERRGRPGRPRVAYAVVGGAEPPGPGRRYFLLSRILASVIAGRMPDPSVLAGEAGREWGRAAAHERGLHADAEGALQALSALLEDLGFAPRVEADGEGATIWLHGCPFREVADANPEVVCSVHLGLMRGALSEWGSGLTAERLEPFVERDLCRARVSQAGT